MTRKRMATRRSARQTAGWLAGRSLANLERVSARIAAGLRSRPRLSLAAICLLVAGLALGWLPTSEPESTPRSVVLNLPATSADQAMAEVAIPEVVPVPADDSPVSLPEPVPVTEAVSPDWTVVEVQPGQTMERIFREVGLGPGLLHRVVHLDDRTRGLARIRPGDQFAFDIDPDSGFRALRAELDEESWLFVEQGPEGLSSRVEPRTLDRRIVEASGVISSSLFNAAKGAGLSDNMTMRLANIFGWDIDFALDIRTGDRFALVFEEIWREGEYLRDGPILAARFTNQGETFEAIRFDAGNGPDYFAPDGRPMRKAFLRAPLNFTRVTSNFNPRRFHPITRQVRPHNGTDYGAPTGTPVWAAGDGRVIRSAYNNVNGHYIFVQHGNNVVTRYLHLSRRDVRQGDRVRQGQTIGAVGMTGLATGPHLHYEFLVNGVHRNPRTVDLPDAEPLPADLMDSFLSAGRPLLARLDRVEPTTGVMLARRQNGSCEGDSPDC
ncbi:MAG: peptidase M23 [Wenzhouxiangella sp.]|nr:MAG: peptidase M23 [Wenzhouxiangella sp.]